MVVGSRMIRLQVVSGLHGQSTSNSSHNAVDCGVSIIILQLGLLLADGTPTGGRGEDFLSRQPDFFTETAVTSERKVEKSFPSYGRFRKETWPTRQKVFPFITVRALSASNSPSALSAQALWARALRAGWIKNQ